MPIHTLNPYLVFNGTAEKAIQLYEKALGARTDGHMTGKFEALASGGKVTMPLQDTFWGARFGMLTDAFGVNWMFNCSTKKPS